MSWLRRILTVTAFLGVLLGPALALAAVPTLNFTVGTNGIPVPAPAPYQAVRAIYTETLTWQGKPLGPLYEPQDVYVDNYYHYLWIVDTGNNRVIALKPNPGPNGNPRYNQVALVIGGAGAKGNSALNAPQGVAVGPEGIIYIADTGNSRVAAFAPNGTFLQNLNTGTSLTFRAQSVAFKPEKIAVDRSSNIYVAIAGQAYGLAQFDSEGRFLGFFAPNGAAYSITYALGKLFETQAQRAQQAQVLPPEVNDVYYGPDGYLYTTSQDVSSQQIRRLNVAGQDTLTATTQFGLPLSSLPPYVFQQLFQQQAASGAGGSPTTAQPDFISVAANSHGLITALDKLTSYIFQYGNQGQLLYTFGGEDNGNGVLGLFETPSSVAMAPGGDVLVSDYLAHNVTEFAPTKFGLLVQKGIELDDSGNFKQAETYWSQVLNYDSDYDLAHDEMALGLLTQGELLGGQPSEYKAELGLFSQSIQQYYLANDKVGYGTAFSWYRHVWMRLNFTWIFLAFLATWLVVWALVKFAGRRVREHPVSFDGAWARNEFVRIVPMAWRMIKHPAETYFQLKFEEQGTLWQGFVLIALAYLFHVLNLAWTSFDFSPLVLGRTNMIVTSAQFLLPLGTWVVANYLVGDLYEGEANLAEVITGSAYALVPFIALQLPFALLSHVFAPTDGVFQLFQWVQKLWVFYLFFTQVRVLHNLEWGQAIKASIVSVAGIGVLWVMFLIVFGLGEQAYGFVHQIIRDIIQLRS